MAVVSENFARLLNDLRQEVISMKAEHKEMQAEIEALRDELKATKQEAVSNRDQQIRKAVVTNDQDQLETLSGAALNPVQTELVRQAKDIPFSYAWDVPAPNQELLDSFKQAHNSGKKLKFKVDVKPVATNPNKAKHINILKQLEENNIAMQIEASRSAEIKRLREAAAHKQWKSENNALKGISRGWEFEQ